MTQRFSPAADRLFRRWGLFAMAAALLLLGFGLYRSNAASGFEVGKAVAQPMPFSHLQHVGKLGLDCATCHAGAANGAGAGMPSNETCLTCHAELFRGIRSLQPLHRAAAEGRQVQWNAVTRLSDVARFHHGAHARAGVDCAACHGAVERMQVVEKVESMSMDWCVDCHRAAQSRPQASIRPVSAWHRDLTDCSVCHY